MIANHDTHSAGEPTWLISGIATLVLSLATGVPLRCAAHFMPHTGERDRPHLGI